MPIPSPAPSPRWTTPEEQARRHAALDALIERHRLAEYAPHPPGDDEPTTWAHWREGVAGAGLVRYYVAWLHTTNTSCWLEGRDTLEDAAATATHLVTTSRRLNRLLGVLDLDAGELLPVRVVVG